MPAGGSLVHPRLIQFSDRESLMEVSQVMIKRLLNGKSAISTNHTDSFGLSKGAYGLAFVSHCALFDPGYTGNKKRSPMRMRVTNPVTKQIEVFEP